jgi:hypothetical protein
MRSFDAIPRLASPSTDRGHPAEESHHPDCDQASVSSTDYHRDDAESDHDRSEQHTERRVLVHGMGDTQQE